MFVKAKRKIVATIMSILVAVMIVTLGLIYLSSYLTVSKENYELLERRASSFFPNGNNEAFEHKPGRRGKGGRSLDLETFYCVELEENGTAKVIENGASNVYSDEELIQFADSVGNQEKGRIDNLLYRVTWNGTKKMVFFMDNSSFTESFSMLFRNMLIFGAIALILLYFTARYIADRIMKPIEEGYERQKQFTSDAGHELKTPIAAVSANSELLKREIGENQWLENIIFENERMKELVTGMLDLARNEAAILPKEELDLSRLTTGTILPLEASAFERGVMLQSNIMEDITVKGNKAQLEQLITILIDNALTHTKVQDGQEAVVSVELKREKGNAVLTVCNPGDPIPEEEKDRLFERFYRSSEARSYDGHYGLGLAIARSIVTAHNGEISVNNDNGLVCFSAYLSLN